MGFTALITAMVFGERSQDSLLSVSVRRVHIVFSTAGFQAEESRVLTNVKPPRCGEASRKSGALNWVRTQAIGALRAHPK